MSVDHDHDIAPAGPTHRPCSWCATDIPIERRPGRPRLYCRRGCRQRAYEHRHGFVHVRTQRTLPGQAFDPDRRRLPSRSGSGYEQGGNGLAEAIVHALRTSVRPDGVRRETLCGVLAVPAARTFSALHRNACRSCSARAASRPLQVRIESSNELARLRAIIEEAQEHRHDPAAAFAWLTANHPERRARAA